MGWGFEALVGVVVERIVPWRPTFRQHYRNHFLDRLDVVAILRWIVVGDLATAAWYCIAREAVDARRTETRYCGYWSVSSETETSGSQTQSFHCRSYES